MDNEKHVILYIDDDEDFREAMGAILQASGYEMLEADSAEAGLRVLNKAQPNLIIVDLMMEEVDAGVAFVKEVRAAAHKPVPIIMVSSAGDTLSMNVDVSGLGLAGVFQKPVDGPSLLKLLKARLG